MASLKNMNNSDLDLWEKQFEGFTSLRNIDYRAAIAQEEHFNKLTTLSQSEKELLASKSTKDYLVCQFVRNHADVYTIESSGEYNLNVPIAEMDRISLINKHGLLKIGNALLVYDRYNIKLILDGDESKLNLLSNIDEGDIKEKIMVYSYIENISQIDENSRVAFFGNDACVDYSGAGGQRVIGSTITSARVIHDIWGTYGPVGIVYFQPQVLINIKNEINRGWPFGWGGKLTDEMEIIGTVYVGVSQPPIAISWNNKGNNLKSFSYSVYNGDFYEYYFEMPFEGDVSFEGRSNTKCSL